MKNAPIRHRLEYAAFMGFRGLLRSLPHAAAWRVAESLGTIGHFALPSRRKIALENLRLAFPQDSEQQHRETVRKMFRHLGLAFCDPLSAERFDAVEFCHRLTLEGWRHFQEAQALGKGVFVMSAHLGCWEAAAQPIGLYGGSMDVVGRPMDNPFLDRALTRLRTRFGNRVLDKRGAARGMMKALRKGGAVGILIDQRSPDHQDAVEVPFFGQPSRTSSVLARLSLRTGAPVVPIFGYPEPGGRYRVVLRPAIGPQAKKAQSEVSLDDQILDLTGRYMECVEKEIRDRPELWMWLHRRWRSAPKK
ncbi:MAG: lysophospholipid acyltransferase family protein [Deltaproteobacteria bacterium]|nr:lysophospholipid acyltransferase family protein [Deltaproteobacteria bacterium]